MTQTHTTTTHRGGRPPGEQVGRRSLNRERGLVWFALPSIVWYAVFTIGPLAAMFWVATLDWRGFNGKQIFIGFGNFSRMFADPHFYEAVWITFVHMIATLPVMMVASFMIGYFLNLKLPGHRILRVIMFIPALISLSALGTLFIAVLGPTGLVNSVFRAIGLDQFETAWLANPQWALPSLIGISIWSGTGFNAILFAARLSAIDDQVYDAAELDGANDWQKMWRVAFPISLDYFGVLTMLQYLWTLFGSAGLIYILTRGGPGYSTFTLSYMVFKYGGLEGDFIGYSQAIGIVLFVVGMLGLLVIRRFLKARY